MISTEEQILVAAKNVFHRSGYAGARMQEIADEAAINKAMLHYYYKNKQQLFRAVFMQAFGKLAPQLNAIFSGTEGIFEKIRWFTADYIDFVVENPYLPSFIIQELNNNPDFAVEFMSHDGKPNPQPFIDQLNKEIAAGTIRQINPKQVLLNIFALSAFPFVAPVMVKGLLNISEEEFEALMEERKTLIADQIIDSIKI
ncbi:MAG: TetR/AcrR family transcriptional regulator [Altibacter sp.]|uniref:TetR/AcrR family transcriptional regulator n=1 Tax=Altibacter sp. TaxID=2024823 RepID=UPI001DE4F810|nr:TetR/AcrR family transcriptional regulator [Altibacter sp.]MBZ0327997.1 TetR/AcrR family transcriptional regulator [Altibacter sp.]